MALLCAVFMTWFCPASIYRFFKPVVDLLAGIPSIVYGFFGLMVIVPVMGEITGTGGKSILTGSVILAVMILPTVINVAESSIRAVPESYYEGSMALGATHEKSVFSAVLPAARSGLTAGVVLGIGRAVGETMAVVMVAGNQTAVPGSLLSGVRTMTANIVLEMGYAGEGLHRDALVATAVVLMVFVLIINLSFSMLKKGGRTMKAKKAGRKSFSAVFRTAVMLSAVITAAAALLVLVYILYNGIPGLTLKGMFSWQYDSQNVSMLPAIINTGIMTLLSLTMAVPMGVMAAIYLAEYAKRGNPLINIIRIMAETLAGIPSIVYGLFGYILFVITLGWGYTLLSGAITLAVMILPLIMRTTEEALMSVPDSYREGSFGLGAGRLRTIFRIIIPAAVPGIAAGVILSIGRIVGESAALIFTAGTYPAVPDSLFASTRTLAVHMYALLTEGLYEKQAYATAVVLLVMVGLINAASGILAKRLAKGGR